MTSDFSFLRTLEKYPDLPILDHGFRDTPTFGVYQAYIAYEAGRRNKARPEPKEETPAETPEARMARGLFAGLR